MTAYHGCKACCCRIEIEGLQVVQHIKDVPFYFDGIRFWKLLGPSPFVYIAAYGPDGCYRFKRLQHFGFADVPRVKDQI